MEQIHNFLIKPTFGDIPKDALICDKEALSSSHIFLIEDVTASRTFLFGAEMSFVLPFINSSIASDK